MEAILTALRFLTRVFEAARAYYDLLSKKRDKEHDQFQAQGTSGVRRPKHLKG